MAASMAARPPPGSPTTSHRTRSSGYCTHKKLTRIYDHYGQQKCTICKRVPDFGYLYCCTQDTDGNLPISAFIDDNMSTDLADLQVSNQATSMIASSTTASSTTSSNSRNASFSTNNTTQTDDAMEDDVATDEVLARAFDGKRKYEVAFPPEPEKYEAVVSCKIRVCHACRPVYKDRAWQSLNAVVNTTPAMPSQYELDNRRISDASSIMKMQTEGEVQPKTPYELIFHGLDLSKYQVFPDSSSSSEDLAASYHAKIAAANNPLPVNIPAVDEDISPKVSLHVKNVTLEKQCEHASDADDEQGFARDDESGDSSADDQYNDETLSDTEDPRPLFGISGTTLHLVSNDRAESPEGLSDSSSGYYHYDSMPDNEEAMERAGSSEKEADVPTEKKVTPGRFLID